MLPENEYTEFEERKYINPQVSLDEQLGFIDNLRATQQANNAEIRQDTYNLGTAVPSNLGGLVGGEGHFTSRYQTPQTNALVADLRASAQAKALSDVLKNEQDMMRQRYNKARQAYNRRARSGGGGGGSDPTLSDLDGNIEQTVTTAEVGDIQTEGIAKSRYQKLFMKYIQAGYPAEEAEARAKSDFGKSIDVDAAVEPYNGGK